VASQGVSGAAALNQRWFYLVLLAEVEMDGVLAAVRQVLSNEHTAVLSLSHDDLGLPWANAGLLTVARDMSINERRPR
jgi:hypothetical protein